MSSPDSIERAFAGMGRISVQAIASLASPRIVKRGLVYYRGGRVTEVALRQGRVEAMVTGTGEEPYLVRTSWDGEEISCHCSCPFDWEPFCKHGIAALLAWSKAGPEAEELIDAGFEELTQEMLAEREQRGRKQSFKVQALGGDRFFGAFQVESLSGKSYQVEIRSLSEKLNRCTCPDYATSMLGTCKHIEAVLARIFKQAPKKAKRLAATPPEVAQVLVSREDAPTIVVRLPPRPTRQVRALCGEFFDLTGRLKVDAGVGFQEFLARARALRNLEVNSDALEFSAEVLRERRFKARSEQVTREVLAGGGKIPGLRADLYPFQVEGSAFLASAGRALLADDMGLGKTVQAIAATAFLMHRGEVERTLIVCPASLKHQWMSEIARFADIEATVLEGGPGVRHKVYRARPTVLIANYEVVRRDLDQIASFAPDLLILDEAQRIKNWRTITAESIKAISTPYAFVLTGTPLENRLEDLYSLMQVVDRRVLGPLWQFDEHFVERNDRGKALGYRRLGELRRRLRPVLKRRDKREVLTQLPERIDNIFHVPLTKAQREIMEEAEQAATRIVAMAQKRPLRPVEMERLMRLMQIARMACNAAGLVDKETKGSPKIEELSGLLREVCAQEGHKVVVFTQWVLFQEMAVAEAKRLKLDHVVLNGSVPSNKRGKLIERFMTDPECKIFFSTDSGGVGLNLQAADTVINLDLPWNPAVLEQRIARVHRQGQRNAVNVLILISEKSFEERLWAILSGKRAIFDAALDANADVDEVGSPTSCLKVASELYGEDQEVPEGFVAAEDADRGELFEEASAPSADEAAAHIDEATVHIDEATDQAGEIAAPVAPHPEPLPQGEGVIAPSATSPALSLSPPSIQSCADLLGHRLEQVVRLSTGQLVAIVDRVDELTRDVTDKLGMIPLSREAAEGMSGLGAASPLAQAEVLLDRQFHRNEQVAQRRRQQIEVAQRKLSAARSLRAGGLAAEALDQASSSMHQAIRSMAPPEGEEATMVPARLLYEVLVPQGKLSLEQAGLIQRAEALARAYSTSTAPVPEGLLSQVIHDAERLLRELESA